MTRRRRPRARAVASMSLALFLAVFALLAALVLAAIVTARGAPARAGLERPLRDGCDGMDHRHGSRSDGRRGRRRGCGRRCLRAGRGRRRAPLRAAIDVHGPALDDRADLDAWLRGSRHRRRGSRYGASGHGGAAEGARPEQGRGAEELGGETGHGRHDARPRPK